MFNIFGVKIGPRTEWRAKYSREFVLTCTIVQIRKNFSHILSVNSTKIAEFFCTGPHPDSSQKPAQNRRK